MPAIIVKGAIIVIGVVGTTAVAISQLPQVRALAQDCRRKIAVALHNLGDEINPNQQPLFNRPEDAEGFMQPNAAGGEMDADEESRRRQREELMYWNAIKLENLAKQKAKENNTKGPTFDDILRKNSDSEEGTAALKSGVEIQGDEGTLRRRGEGSRGMDRGSTLANPFADENYVDSDGDAKMIAPEEDEVEDIYTANDLRAFKKPASEKRVLPAASDYPLGQHYTTQLEISSPGVPQSQEGHDDQLYANFSSNGQENRENQAHYGVPPAVSDFSNANPFLPKESDELSSNADPSIREQLSVPSYPPFSNQVGATAEEPRNQIPDNSGHGMPKSVEGHGSENKRMRDQGHQLQDYQLQLMLLEQQNKRRKLLALQENGGSSHEEPEADYNRFNGSNMAAVHEMHSMLLDQQNKKRLMCERQEMDQSSGKEPEAGSSNNQERQLPAYQVQLTQLEQNNHGITKAPQMLGQSPSNHALQDYQMQLMLLDQQNKKRLMIARQEKESIWQSSCSTDTSSVSTSSTQEHEQLVDFSELPNSIQPSSTPNTTGLPINTSQTPESVSGPDSAFASIHAWADNNNNTSFYSPLPGTPKALSSAASEPEYLSGGDITPTDSISLAGSGVDVANDNVSSFGGDRYDDVMSVDGGIHTPSSWTEVGSVVSEDDASHH